MTVPRGVYKSLPKKLWPFQCHGVAFDIDNETSGDEFIGTCPFSECTKSGHFYVNKNSGMFSCKRCGRSGNVLSFLTTYHADVVDNTSGRDYRRLSRLRGMPVPALRRFDVGYADPFWLLPVRNENGSVVDIRRWRENSSSVLSTNGCKSQLFGLNRLKKIASGSRPVIWLCEGEWDVMALSEMLVGAKRHGDAVLGVPGCHTFRDDWSAHFSRRRVVIVYDNDAPGDSGSAKAAKHIIPVAHSVKFVCWPDGDSLPDGFDVRDWFIDCNRRGISAGRTFNRFNKLIRKTHRRPDTVKPDDVSVTVEVPKLVLPDSERPTLKQLYTAFGRWLEMDTAMKDTLRVLLATVMSEQIRGDPLWLYLVGPPGSGKTALLCSFSSSDRCLFRSSITPSQLVSGFRTSDGSDPSLLAIVNGKILILKDGTELFSPAQVQRDETASRLRGAYDGEVVVHFGNDVQRVYGPLHFTLIIGVTPVLFTNNQASLGDRFLRYYMPRATDEEARVRRAIECTGMETESEDECKDAVKRFLAVDVKRFPRVPDWMARRLVPLCTLIGRLRTDVCMSYRDSDDVLFRPDPEYGTRLAKQLVKLAVTLSLVDGFPDVVTYHSYRLMERIAFSTVHPFYLDVLSIIRGAGERGVVTGDLVDGTGLPVTTIGRVLKSLRLLEVVHRLPHGSTGSVGRNPYYFAMRPETVAMWERCRVGVEPGAQHRVRVTGRKRLPGRRKPV